ncbi:MAG TPA: NAD(P)/FAD-dependent oxidoreductase [Anaerolineales bacterium]|nr:NAD(P)/FAD-dependent oxidoreductase [Anaerolineales bacterium]
MGKINTVAIIGGGVSGLSAGGLLSRKGLRVKLFEANDKLGGSCANTEIDGYTFHDGALYLAFPGLLEHVFERLGLDRPSLLPLRKIIANQRTTLPDGTVVSFGNEFGVTITGNKGRMRNIQLQKELEEMLKKWEPVFRLFADDILLHPFSLSRLVAKGWHHLPKLHGCVASEINHLFSDEAVQAAMSGALLFSGIPPQRMPVQSILGLVAMFTEGFYLPEGGMGKIPEALSQSLKNNGGEILLNSTINRIVPKNGRVHGLKVDGQGLVEVDAVISTVSGMLTYGSLLNQEEVPNWMKRKVQGAPLSHKSLVIQLGLSNVVDVRSHSNNILPWMDEQYKMFMSDGDEVKWPVYSVPTVTIPELSPRGGSIIEMFPRIKQDMPADDWNDQKKERILESAIKALSSIRDIDIAVKRVRCPKDFQDRMHLYKGATYGLSPAASPKAQFQHVSPIRGLYQAGQTTYPGFGVSPAAMSGILAAETLMRTAKL